MADPDVTIHDSPTRSSVVMFIIAIVTSIVVGVSGTTYAIWNATHHTDVITSQQQKELQASCAFWLELAVAPVKPNAPVQKPSKLGISIVVGSRYAYLGEECGKLPAPSAELEQWAAYYKLSLPG
jgi:hypothetical protein